MKYPGDPSLTPDIQNRVLATFEHTSKLASEGKLQEALLGCDFMLRLDPLFTPAKRLHERLDGAAGPVATGDLLGAAADEPTPEVLKTVRLSAEELERLMAQNSPAAAADDVPSIELEPIELGLTDDPDQGVAGEATSFLSGARRALDSGQIEAARRLLDMAGSLDPHSPELQTLRAELDAMSSGPALAPASASGDRIEQLLHEGQRAFDAERYQEAIDCWSRIFLIEIDHEEASRRIQRARDLKEEQDRQVEETFHLAIGAADAGRKDDAIAAFRRVLELRPNHVAAREQLDQLGGARVAEAPATTARAAAPVAAAVGAEAPGVELPAEGPARQADPTYRMAARAKRPPISPLFLIGAAVLLLVAAGAWLLAANWDRLFPNATEEVAPQPGQALAQITAMYDRGELEAAIAEMEQISPDSPDYLQARRLLERWRQELAAKTDVAAPLTGDAADRHGGLISDARQAYDRGHYLEAARLFTRASAIAPLGAAEAALFDDSKRQLEPIAQQIDLYTQRQWELVLPALWRRFEQAPQDKDVHQLLVNTYFNMAVRELRRSDIEAAEQHVVEAARLAPEDEEVARLQDLTKTYAAMPRDLLYDIYVQHLEFRH